MSEAPDPEVWKAAEALWDDFERSGMTDVDAYLAERSELQAEVVALFRRLWTQQSGVSGPTSDRLTERLDAMMRRGSMARDREGEIIGRFRLIRALGEGGAGVVYLAEEQQEDLFHQVAIKLLHERFSTDDPALRAALHERRLLARLAHPCITRYYESGLTDDGVFYVVVEYVQGVPITEHVRRTGSTAGEALRLFVHAVRAVHYAHQNLIVHRDIKPSNLLVEAEHGLPKLLDFGIARDLEGRADDEHTVVFACTPAYASPEQLTGLATIGTPTDLYSLGVVLYELLFGELPVSPGVTNPIARLDLLRRLEPREVEASACSISLDGLNAGQRRDLTAVIRRLLSFHPEDRYPSAEALAADIDRILHDQPIGWGHHSIARRTARLIGRHRALSATALAGLAVLVGAVIVYGVQAHRLAQQADRLASVRSVLSDLLTRPDPLRRGSSVTLAETVKEMAPSLAADTSMEPEVKAEVEAILGQSLLRLGEIDQARDLLLSARQHYRANDPEAPQRLDIEANLALADMEAGQYAEAKQRAQRLLSDLRAPSQRDALREATALRVLATAEIFADNALDDAADHAREAIALLAEGGSSGAEESNTAKTVLALALSMKGDLDEARQLQRAVLDAVVAEHGADSGQSFDPRNNLARTMQKQGHLDIAEALMAQNVNMAVERFGAEAPDTLMAQNNLAVNLFRQGRFDEAAPLMRAVHAGRVKVLGDGHPRTSMAASNLADALIQTGAVDEACALSQNAEQALRANPDAAPHLRGYPAKVHARCLLASGSGDEALAEVRAVVELWQRELGDDHLDTLSARQDEARVLAALGRVEEATALLDEVVGLRTDRYGADHPSNVEAAASRAAWQGGAR